MEQLEVNGDHGVAVTAEENKKRTRIPRKAKISIIPNSVSSSKGLERKTPKNKLERYYLSKKVKLMAPSLETVFEEPLQQEGNTYCSKRKFKRLLEFDVMDRSCSAKRSKTKKRIIRAKKLVTANRYLKRKKISMKAFMSKIAVLEENKDRAETSKNNHQGEKPF